jgi:hypothetical protein
MESREQTIADVLQALSEARETCEPGEYEGLTRAASIVQAMPTSAFVASLARVEPWQRDRIESITGDGRR